ncbi:CoA transferase [Rhodococcoides kyotonense]|uniref:2-methylfumaryl-CoA isomerase n=1 Tax=Rhodococcoides kyotonense TaxID=398843 RepID=A0A239MQB7_9NOCA|nr:CoA transferase [Rhodococcus kyotonensis]SNT45027.1 2-methylfumaryl-CoA isomerase [Rhodococcus kyotonensis]
MQQSSNRPDSAPLAGLTVVEVSAFVAAPLGGMTLAQLGAEVIRIDPIGGNIDINRWPVTADGTSIYWASLNKGKKSVTLDLRSDEGREQATQLMVDAGIVLTNLPARGWMGYEQLVQRREDLIMMRLTGNYDGSSAVDYSVNCASGFPLVTGDSDRPVNHVLPAWDVAAGLYLATGLLAAERVRRLSGYGQEVTIALSDVMLATVGNLGYLADVRVNGTSRQADGNSLYGGFGREFRTSDDRDVMVVALTTGQWKALTKATGLGDKLAMIEPMLDVDLSTDSGRYAARYAIAAVLEPWFAARTLAEVGSLLDAASALWGPYRTFEQLLDEDRRCSTDNPLFAEIEQPGIGTLLTPAVPLSFGRSAVPSAQAAPVLGADTVRVLSRSGFDRAE